MKKLHIWDGAEFRARGCIAKTSQEKEICELSDAEIIPKPLTLFLVPDKHWEELPTFIKFLEYKYEFSPSPDALSLMQGKLRMFNSWEGVLEGAALERFDYEANFRLLKKAKTFLDLVTDTFVFCDQFLSTSILGQLRATKFRHDWWEGDISLTVFTRDFLGKYEHLSRNDICRKSLQCISANLRVLTECEVGRLEDKFVVASAYTYASSKRAIELKDFDRALLLFHRSIDLVLQSLLIENRLVTVFNKALKYVDSEFEKKPVGLENSRRILVGRRVVRFDIDQARTLNSVNFARNRLLLTHSFYSVDEPSVLDLSSRTYDLIRGLTDGRVGISWRSALKSFLSKPQLEKVDLFDFEDSFDAYIRVKEIS